MTIPQEPSGNVSINARIRICIQLTGYIVDGSTTPEALLDSFTSIISFISNLNALLCQIALFLHTATELNDATLMIISFSGPLANYYLEANIESESRTSFKSLGYPNTDQLRGIARFWYSRNRDYNRKEAMKAMTNDIYQEEVALNNLGQHILQGQYIKQLDEFTSY